MEEANIGSRHLGLLTPGEIADLNQRFRKVAEQLEKTVNLGRLMGVGGGNRENSRSRPPKTVPTKELLCHRRGVGCGLLFLLCG